MSRWAAPTLLVAAGGTVLLLGAAANGFEPSLEGASPSSSTISTRTQRAPPTDGVALRVSVVALLNDRSDNSAAVVLRVTNPNTRHALADAPVAIELLDRRGNIVGTSAAAGTDPILVRVPYVRAGGSALFVSDTIAASGAPSEVRATATAKLSTARAAPLAVRASRLRRSPFGWVAAGTLVGSNGTRQRRVLVQGVVRRQGRIVAAGTMVVAVRPRESSIRFEIQLVGDAEGGALRVWAWSP